MSFHFSVFCVRRVGVILALGGLVHSTFVRAQAIDSVVTELAPMTITGTREKAPLAETPVSVGAVRAEAIRETAPLHPGHLLSQVPGVAVAVTNGEGHTTAIRQPFTTSPVYLYLEDGIPVRATGFFNHNALYEVNLPMAGGVEVVRGPGTALHGSDAIGGIVNILSRAPSAAPHAAATLEGGAFGTRRIMASGGGGLTAGGDIQLDLNLTHTDGWRERTGYHRRSANLRFDQRVEDATMLKALVSYSSVDQQTGANAPLTLADFENDPIRNNHAIAYRKVNATRISVEYERQLPAATVSLIPYFRDNAMELNGTFNLSSDPRIERTHNVSYGLLAKVRTNLPQLRTRLIGGFDFDYSSGTRQEDNLLVTRIGGGANTQFTGYMIGTRIYDYAVRFTSASPYLHAEFSPTARLRLTTGVRYDALRFDLANALAPGVVSASVLGANRFYGQIAENRADFSRLNPKFGATYALTRNSHLYGSYNFGFRAPSEGQLYRAGNDTTATSALTRAHLATGLKPIKATQAELGWRGDFPRWSLNLVAYRLVKSDDLVSQRDLATNVSTNVNAGRTRHEGVEAGLGMRFAHRWRFDTAFSYASHRYVDWTTATANFSGKEMEAAPNIMTNTRLTWKPLPATMLQFEWVRVGSYWLEAGNSPVFGKYPGHDLLNLRANHALTRHVGVFARLMNATDKRFADSASVSSNTRVFSPGLPRAAYVGVDLNW